MFSNIPVSTQLDADRTSHLPAQSDHQKRLQMLPHIPRVRGMVADSPPLKTTGLYHSVFCSLLGGGMVLTVADRLGATAPHQRVSPQSKLQMDDLRPDWASRHFLFGM